MIRQISDRFSCWFNRLNGDRQVLSYFCFCLVFLVALWLSIRYIAFNAYVDPLPKTGHIGSASGPNFNNSTTFKKN